jgi:hypothetical protein
VSATMCPKFRFVCATRLTTDGFFQKSALGRSLSLYSSPNVEVRLFDENRTGIPTLYNKAINESESDPAILIFIHDDVHLCDFFWAEKIVAALNIFEVVGLVGNRRRVPKQPSWAFVDENLAWDSPENFSGVIGHGKGFPPDTIDFFGAPRHEVKLLDGLMLFCRSETLISKNLRFDERFDFHFYDLDFCRQAELKETKMGTWPISAIHESGGEAGSVEWKLAYVEYLSKWGN